MNTPENMANLRYTRPLLIKRDAFSYEEEVRLIYSDPNSAQHGMPVPPKIHDVPINFNQLYNYIELDPTMTPADANAAR